MTCEPLRILTVRPHPVVIVPESLGWFWFCALWVTLQIVWCPWPCRMHWFKYLLGRVQRLRRHNQASPRSMGSGGMRRWEQGDSLQESFFSSLVPPEFKLPQTAYSPGSWKKFLAGPRNSLVVLMGHLSGSAGWVCDSWFWLRWGSGCPGLEPCIGLSTQRGVCSSPSALPSAPSPSLCLSVSPALFLSIHLFKNSLVLLK